MGLESGWGWWGELPGSHPFIKPSGKLTRQAACLVLVPKFGSSVVYESQTKSETGVGGLSYFSVT